MTTPSPIILTRRDGGALVRATISPVGASLQGLSVAGVELVRGSLDATPVESSGITLVPWPNRVRAARWEWKGQEQALLPTEAGTANALHGLLAATDYAIARHSEGAVLLTARIDNAPGYPFALDVSVEYHLAADGIRVSLSVHNRGGELAPVGLGAHPYLRLGDTPAAELTLSVPAERALLLTQDHLPAAMVSVAGTPLDLREGRRVTESPAHLGFTALRAESGAVTSTLSGPMGRAELWMDPRFRWLQIYLTREFPGLADDQLAIAVEPMTAPPDALNSGIDLHLIAPADTWSLDWGIRFVPA
ncbi:aldose epimerase [Mycetocola tolaasinivorans]|uniref:aldose epimerase family protein n=1 Tax=Mycetocola tolaasinivorans TaxID=76635 RepID=UPI0016029B59|nr:aldose epimerase [Mycetocola tolaasinivorans]